jgi:AraC-like DNA-binding protein
MANGFEQQPRGEAVFLRRQAPPWRVDVGAHASVHVVVRGSFYLAHDEPRALWLGPGDVVLLTGDGAAGAGPKFYCSAPPPEAARLAPAEPGELLSAFYAPVADRRLVAGSALHLPAGDVRRDGGLSAVVGLLRAALADPSAGQERLAHSLLAPLFEYVLHCHARARAGGREGVASAVADERVARALRLLQSRPADRWSVAALAKAAGLSRAAFARRFSAALGLPPLRYLVELRMQLAARLLAEGDDSLAVIAAQIGYESEFAFGRAFKRHTGEAPGAFRRARRSVDARLRALPTRAAA